LAVLCFRGWCVADSLLPSAATAIISHYVSPTLPACVFCVSNPTLWELPNKTRAQHPPWHRATAFLVLAAAAAKPTDQKDPGALLVPRRAQRTSGRREQNSTNRSTEDTPTPDDLTLTAGLKAGLIVGLIVGPNAGLKAGLNAGRSPLHTTNPGDPHAEWTTLPPGP
jgi:hypothetical protein